MDTTTDELERVETVVGTNVRTDSISDAGLGVGSTVIGPDTGTNVEMNVGLGLDSGVGSLVGRVSPLAPVHASSKTDSIACFISL